MSVTREITRVCCCCPWLEFFLTSLKPLHGFASDFMWMFLRWIHIKFVQIGGFNGIMGNFMQ